MRKFFVCLLIILLVACSNKKTPPDAEIEILDETNVNAAVAQEFQSEPQPEENSDVLLKKTKIYAQYEGYNFIVQLEDVEVSSERSGEYAVRNLVDRTWRSWAEGSDGNGIGEYISLTWGLYSDARTVAGFALKNGHGNLDHYTQYNRVKSFKIYADEEYIGTIPIKDSISFEQYVFAEPVAGKTVRFVIDDVYPGTKFNDTCVAEIALLIKRVSDREFYENILDWISISHYSPIKYENNSQQMVSVPDAEKLLLLDYLPFDLSYFPSESYSNNWDPKTAKRLTIETKIALLNDVSSLRLKDNLPRLDGATAMYPLYSSFVHAVYPEVSVPFDFPGVYYYEHLNLIGFHEWGYFPNERLILDRFWSKEGHLPPLEYKSIVQCNTTSQAFQRLIDGETDIIFCYEPSTAEKNAAVEKGKRFNLTPIAYDAFVFIVNEKNSLSNITQRQIRDIYSGRVTNWKDISGVDEPLIAYQRSENSGSQTTLQSIMKEDTLIRPVLDGEYVSGGMYHSIRKIASDYYNYNSAIGYTFLFYLTHMAGDSGVKVLAADGVTATRQTIQNKKYPFVQTVYAITTGNESENTKKFIEWILSAQGQELVAKTGYTPVK